ncbi:hypothetical protein KEC56_03525 [Microbacterium sp. YMB-B2]|uniref:Alkaline shock response membrane anchor protein AmaP n=1 Tax=Microbacterium tenebrionis TaxID=2830665 RepID=A0A9X1RZC3_9MICO|nr:alkaline shock response membrane anchor protein AmaP [Microbacterium tenebrionis]MCC2028604.1 hypothetical protein [Microbacterium tenebrionis]
MNRTNRALNRIVLFIVGLLFLAIGAVLVTIIVWPAATEYWTGATEAGRSWLEGVVDQTLIGATAVSWIAIAALVLIVFLVILLIVALTRIGGGRTHTVLRSTGSQSPLGRVTVQESFVSDALKHSLNQRDEILFSSVTANDIRKQPVMHISVTPRQNTSPRQVVKDVDQLVTNLATLTGKDTPTYISVHSGLRAKLAHDERRLA